MAYFNETTFAGDFLYSPDGPPTPIRIAVAGPIPPCSDQGTQGRLDNYRVLARPLPVPPLPAPESFRRLKDAAPHADQAIDVLERPIVLARSLGARCFASRPLLLVGPPGSGKTWLARRLAELLAGRVTRLYPCGGLNNAIPLRGQSRAFHESAPGVVVQLLAEHRSAGGCIVWDELDKVGTSTWNGDPLHALIQLLEPATSVDLYDDFLQTPVNLGFVNHIATANRADAFPPALLSRFHVVEFGKPDVTILRSIIAQFRVDLARRLYLPEQALPALDDLSMERLLRLYERSPDLRAAQCGYEDALLGLTRKSVVCAGADVSKLEALFYDHRPT